MLMLSHYRFPLSALGSHALGLLQKGVGYEVCWRQVQVCDSDSSDLVVTAVTVVAAVTAVTEVAVVAAVTVVTVVTAVTVPCRTTVARIAFSSCPHTPTTSIHSWPHDFSQLRCCKEGAQKPPNRRNCLALNEEVKQQRDITRYQDDLRGAGVRHRHRQ